MRFQSKRGITLLELLVAITLLAVVGAMVYPSFGNALSNLRLEGVARQLRSICRLAKWEAVSHHQPYRLVVNLERDQLYVADAGAQIIKGLDLPPGIRIFQVQKRSENGPSNVSELYFFPDGTAEGGSVTLRDGGGREITIVIDFLTAEARISD